MAKTDSNKIPISTDELGSYFKSLLAGPEVRTYANPPHDLETSTVLDDTIEEEEVRAAISSLKNNKAPGHNGLSPTVFKLFNNHLISFTTTLFNKLLEQGTFPDSWSTGAIKPTYKKGNKGNPSNYRGIHVATYPK